MRDYQSGKRRSSEAKSGPHLRMTSTAINVNEDEILQAARYFALQKYQPWINVLETAQVPKTKVIIGSMLAASGEEGMEPIGQHIVEIPIDLKRTELRDPRIGFLAYVPEGSIHMSEVLVTTGGGEKTLACVACHGNDLKGVGNIPPIAGRSAQYLARQLYDMQKGTRDGVNAALMKPVVKKLSEDDIINIVAYVSSRAP